MRFYQKASLERPDSVWKNLAMHNIGGDLTDNHEPVAEFSHSKRDWRIAIGCKEDAESYTLYIGNEKIDMEGFRDHVAEAIFEAEKKKREKREAEDPFT